MTSLRRFFSLCVLWALPALSACSASDVSSVMEEYLWQKRVLLIFTDTPASADIAEQNKQLVAATDGIKSRDIVTWYIAHDTSVSVNGELKPQLSTRPFYRYFNVDYTDDTVILLGKDGEEKYRGALPVPAQTLFTLIDAMPLRKEEQKEATQTPPAS